MAQTLNIIIDVTGLKDFHKDDNNPEWGKYSDKPCKADSFCVLMANDSTFTGSTGRILILEQGSEYIWKISALNNETLTLSHNGENRIELEMVQNRTKDWNEIFELDAYHKVEGAQLIIKEVNSGSQTFNLKTVTPTSSQTEINYIKFTYSIKFTFFDPDDTTQTPRFGIIDPFISVRSDDPVPQS
jgi:hypothetical protein